MERELLALADLVHQPQRLGKGGIPGMIAYEAAPASCRVARV
jgi:hypothetical protein